MKYLWAPWRMSYILGEREKGCFFCKKLKEGEDKKNLILHRGRHAFIVMNMFPYNNGHVMVVPKRHCLELDELDGAERKELFDLVVASTRSIKASLHPHGFNIGVNVGKAGGAGVEHLHVHIVPRWSGDTNFMPVLGEIKIIPQYLEKTYKELQSALATLLKIEEGRKGGQKR